MIDHVSTRCGEFRLLFPTRNIEAIIPVNSPSSISPLKVSHRRPPAPIAVDLRLLLNPKAAQQLPSCIRLDWVSSDSERRAILIVDSVDEIVNSPHGQLERCPLLPHRVLHLCDGLLHDSDGTYRMSIRLDGQWPMTPLSEGRLLRKALVTLEENSGPVQESPTTPA